MNYSFSSFEPASIMGGLLDYLFVVVVILVTKNLIKTYQNNDIREVLVD